MTTSEFEAQLKHDGFNEIETKQLEPKPANGMHGHHFAVRGLVLEGQFIITQNEQPVAYTAGQVYSVAAGETHCEEVGSAGARVLFGRKY